MKRLSLLRSWILSLMVLFILCSKAQAGHEYGSSRVVGASIAVGTNLQVTDNKYAQMAATPAGPWGFSDYKSTLSVRVGVDHANTNTIPAYDLTLKVKVEYLTYNTSSASFTAKTDTTNLRVSYSPSVLQPDFQDLSVYNIVGGYQTKVTVLGVTYNSTTISAIPSNLFLELLTDAERYYTLDYTNIPYAGISSPMSVSYDSNSDEYLVQWNWIPGAESYDLEWTWVSDDFDLANFPYLVDFRSNSTRVNVTTQNYRISNIFDKGRLYFRLRGQGRYIHSGTLSDYFTPWTWIDQQYYPQGSTVPTLMASLVAGVYGQSGANAPLNIAVSADHEQHKNWQYSATYAEEGKKKEVISYFDGSLRNRQSVTKTNTDGTIIVGETYYDYQGRAAVQALPVPVEDAKIKFYEYNVTSSSSTSQWGFNFSAGTKETFNRKHFDIDGTDSCSAISVGMEPNKGASYYYSSNNIDKTFQQGYVPDAELYPYTTTEYTPDNTGRVNAQSGVGAVHKLGGTHATKYLYSSPTSQTELDRLFGSEVGNVTHYKKNMVIDPNGQISISYLDQEGRTIATALAGKAPGNTTALASNTGTTAMTADLLHKHNANDPDTDQDLNILQAGGKQLSFSKEISVEDIHAQYKFAYDMTGTAFTYSCATENTCYDCIYSLEINIVDKCGNPPAGFTPMRKTVGNILPGQIDTVGHVTYNLVCDGPIQFSTQPSALTVILEPGAYTVTKTLSIDEDAMSYYLQQYLTNNSCIKTEQSFIDSALAKVDTSGCNLSCDQCVAALGSLATYTANGGTEADYNALVKACRQPCEYTSSCESAYQALLADVSPGGQYAEMDTNNVCNPSLYPLSVLNVNNQLPIRMASGGSNWKNSSLQYYDEYGQRSYVTITQTALSGGGYSYSPAVDAGVVMTTGNATSANTFTVYPQQLANVCDFVGQWNNTWAQELVKFHPEYFYYEWCIQNSQNALTGNDYNITISGNTTTIRTSDDYDSLLVSVQTLTSTSTPAALLNPLGIGTGASVADPYFDVNEPASKWKYSTWSGNTTVSDVAQLNGFLPAGYYSNKYPTAVARFNNYLGSGLDLWQYAYAINSTLATQYGTSITPAMVTGAGYNATTHNLSDAAWATFKSLYASLKQSLQSEAAQSYAQNGSSALLTGKYNNSCNTCMGTVSYNAYNVPFGTYNPSSSWSNNWFLNPGNANTAACGLATKDLYMGKTKRFPSTEDVLALGNGNINASLYQLTGQCPLAMDLQTLLNYLGTNNKITTTTASNTVPAFTQLLLTTVNGGSINTTNWAPSGSAKTLSVTVGLQSINCTLTLPSSSPYNWSDFVTGSTTQISLMNNLTADLYNGSQCSFTITAYINTSTGSDIVPITGTIGMDIKSCDMTPTCTGNSTAQALQTMLSLMVANRSFCSTISDMSNTPYGNSFNNTFGYLQPGTSWSWQPVSSGGKFVCSNGAYIELIFPATPTSLCDLSSIAIINSLIPNTSAQGSFELSVSNYPSSGAAPTNTVLTGTLSYNPGSGASQGMNLGSCGTVNVMCTTIPHQVRNDLDNFFTSQVPALLNDSSHVHPLTSLLAFTPLLRSYITAPSGTPVPNYFWQENNPTSTDSVTIRLSSAIGTIPDYMQPACKLRLHLLNTTSTNDLHHIASFGPLTVQNQPLNGTEAYTFTMTATFTNGQTEGVYGETTCYPLRQCKDCESNSSPGSTAPVTVAIEDFETLPGTYQVTGTTSGICATLTSIPANTLTPCHYGVAGTVYYNSNLLSHYGGSNSLFVNLEGPGSVPTSVFSKRIDLPSENGCYQFSGKYMQYVSGQCVMELYLDNNLVANQLINPTGSGWQDIDFAGQTFPIGNNAVTIDLRIRSLSGGSVLAILGIDNLSFSKVDCTSGEAVTGCGETLNLEPLPTVPYVNPCVLYQQNSAIAAALDNYSTYLDSLKADFVQQYLNKCMGGVIEHFNLQYSTSQHHFTLYYYDQASNLVRTVPPAGVNVVTNPTDLQQIETDRYNATNPSYSKVFYTSHAKATTYTYNSLNQLVKQNTPDAGTSYFWYDKLGRLIASQNAQQKSRSNGGNQNYYSYTVYDNLGRIKEVGEMMINKDLNNLSFSNLNSFLNPNTNNYPANFGTVAYAEVTHTYYGDDTSFPALESTVSWVYPNGLSTARGRVAAVSIEDTKDTSDLSYNHATYYNYDVHGNVKSLLQHNQAQVSNTGQQYKYMEYDYDLVSGKVNKVHYQDGGLDAMHHSYSYDADNRITKVFTSEDNVIWNQDAAYFYYKHGPLARTEIGGLKVQGLDYAYTLQGWIKGVNSNVLSPDKDPGKDGYLSATNNNYNQIHKTVAQDAFGYSLNYFSNGSTLDYKAINSTFNAVGSNFIADNTALNLSGSGTSPALYNGNISQMVTSYLNNDPTMLSPLTGQAIALNTPVPQLNAYQYDQLNRIKHVQSYKDISLSGNAWNAGVDSKYEESFSYDADGNIQTLNRKGNLTGSTTMDDLTYSYIAGTNQLDHVADNVGASTYGNDIDNQSNANYTYDKIGNLISDASEGITNISWTVYGKIKSITKSGSKSDLVFTYDASGNRISKLEKTKTTAGAYKTSDQWTTTYYARDAQGNVMATYSQAYNSATSKSEFNVTERMIYGSSRLGVLTTTKRLDIKDTVKVTPTYLYARTLGSRHYELSNHLGNVIAVVTDRREMVQQSGGVIYRPAVIGTTDYYAFGSPIPGRNYSGVKYRYGFNGKENDGEVVGTGSGTQDYGMRIYNPNLGRFLSVDPLSEDYPWYTPYQFAGNKPIWAIDIDGLEEFFITVSINEKGEEVRLYVRNKTKNNDIGKVQYIYVNNPEKNTGVVDPMTEDDKSIINKEFRDPTLTKYQVVIKNPDATDVNDKKPIVVTEKKVESKINKDKVVEDKKDEKTAQESPPAAPPAPKKPTRLVDDGEMKFNAGDVTFQSGTNRLINKILDIKDLYLKSNDKANFGVVATVGVEVKGALYPINHDTPYGDKRGADLAYAREVTVQQLIHRLTGISLDKIKVDVMYNTDRTIDLKTIKK